MVSANINHTISTIPVNIDNITIFIFFATTQKA